MEYKDKCNLMLYMINKVDFFWNRLYVSTAVVIAFVLNSNLVNTQITIDILLLIGYVIFLLSNLFDHIRSYRYLIDLAKEIQLDNSGEFSNEWISKHLNRLPYKYEQYTCIMAYIGAISLNLLIWYISKIL